MKKERKGEGVKKSLEIIPTLSTVDIIIQEFKL